MAWRDVSAWLFFFQAEDGIRDYKVTGVQTCALPILRREPPLRQPFAHHLHGVLAGEHDPVVGRDAREPGAERGEIGESRDADRRGGDDVGAERLQLTHQVARLLARAGDRDAAARERVGARRTRRARRGGHRLVQSTMLPPPRSALAPLALRRAAAPL